MTLAALLALFASVSSTLQLPEGLLAAVCKVESNYESTSYNGHDGGTPSYGVCQIKESTAKLMGFRGRAYKLLDVRTNALYAGMYLKWQLDRYHGDVNKAVAAYNAGSHRTNKKGITLNHRYVAKVTKVWNK